MTTELSKQGTTPTRMSRREVLRPFYRVFPREHAYDIDVYMPGVAKDGAQITLEGHQLRIDGSRRSLQESGWNAILREIPQEDYRLVLDLNVDIDSENIRASSENGVLRVHLPVAEEARPRTIEVT